LSQTREHFLANMAKLITPKQLLLAGLVLIYFSWVLSWKLAVILMAALMFHELGHAWAMRHYGMRINGFYFTPFGLVVVSDDPWPTRQSEAVIALMGPAWGLVMTLATCGVWLATGRPIFAGLACWFALLNAFNLLPTNPLDGGRVAKSLAFSLSTGAGFAMLVIGLALTAALLFAINPVIGVLVFGLGVLEFRHELRQIRRRRDRNNIIKVLSQELCSKPSAEAVLDGLQREVDEIWDKLDLARRFAALRQTALAAGVDPRLVLMRWMLTPLASRALQSRRPYPPIFGNSWSYATADHEMTPLAPTGKVADSPLGRFLLEKELPRMKAGKALLTLAAYLGLAAMLVVLFLAASRTMDLVQVINALR